MFQMQGAGGDWHGLPRRLDCTTEVVIAQIGHKVIAC